MFSSPIGMNVHVTAKFIFAWPQNLFFSLCLQIVQRWSSWNYTWRVQYFSL